jgi:hypothetical protein
MRGRRIDDQLLSLFLIQSIELRFRCQTFPSELILMVPTLAAWQDLFGKRYDSRGFPDEHNTKGHVTESLKGAPLETRFIKYGRDPSSRSRLWDDYNKFAGVSLFDDRTSCHQIANSLGKNGPFIKNQQKTSEFRLRLLGAALLGRPSKPTCEASYGLPQ